MVTAHSAPAEVVRIDDFPWHSRSEVWSYAGVNSAQAWYTLCLCFHVSDAQPLNCTLDQEALFRAADTTKLKS